MLLLLKLFPTKSVMYHYHDEIFVFGIPVHFKSYSYVSSIQKINKVFVIKNTSLFVFFLKKIKHVYSSFLLYESAYLYYVFTIYVNTYYQRPFKHSVGQEVLGDIETNQEFFQQIPLTNWEW